jgi:ATPase subunit of ABC transporter with duplicated ATPase domains
MDWLRQFVPPYIKDVDEPFLRGFLGKMLFSGDDVLKRTSVLSGGEKVRCMISRMMLQNPNVVMLDEPTNHLDAESVAWLERHLKEYKGMDMVVTHDRYFLDNLTTWILELERGEAIPYEGNYTRWLADTTKI